PVASQGVRPQKINRGPGRAAVASSQSHAPGGREDELLGQVGLDRVSDVPGQRPLRIGQQALDVEVAVDVRIQLPGLTPKEPSDVSMQVLVAVAELSEPEVAERLVQGNDERVVNATWCGESPCDSLPRITDEEARSAVGAHVL